MLGKPRVNAASSAATHSSRAPAARAIVASASITDASTSLDGGSLALRRRVDATRDGLNRVADDIALRSQARVLSVERGAFPM